MITKMEMGFVLRKACWCKWRFKHFHAEGSYSYEAITSLYKLWKWSISKSYFRNFPGKPNGSFFALGAFFNDLKGIIVTEYFPASKPRTLTFPSSICTGFKRQFQHESHCKWSALSSYKFFAFDITTVLRDFPTFYTLYFCLIFCRQNVSLSKILTFAPPQKSCSSDTTELLICLNNISPCVQHDI